MPGSRGLSGTLSSQGVAGGTELSKAARHLRSGAGGLKRQGQSSEMGSELVANI